MEILGYILCGLGCIAALAGHIMILVDAFHRGPILFTACLVIPFAAYGYALAHARTLWMPLTLNVCGFGVAFLGLWLSGCEYPMEAMFE